MTHLGPTLCNLCVFAAIRLFFLAIVAIAIIQFNDGYLKLLARWIVRHEARRLSSIQELEALFALPDPRGAKRYSIESHIEHRDPSY